MTRPAAAALDGRPQDIRLVPISKLTPAPFNPRRISKERFANLVRAIEADPDFLWLRPICAMKDGTIYAGNYRYHACVKIGRDVVPAVMEDIPLKLARERMLRDNQQWGEWDSDLLSEEVWKLRDEKVDITLLGFDDKALAKIINRSGGPEVEVNPRLLHTCPQCGNEFAD